MDTHLALTFFVLTAIFCIGCPDTTAILVEVDSADLRVPDDIDALRFAALGADGTRAESEQALTGTWPYSMSILPPESGTRPEVEITVAGLKGGAVQIRRVVRVMFDEGETRRVTIDLARACLGVVCDPRVDCIAGMCAGEDTDGGMPDGGTDAGRVIDAGSDAGAMDAGVDAGDCTPSGPEACGGGDEDCDGMVDEFLPCVGSLVISEVTTGGPASGLDEFVEIHNTTDRPIDLAGVDLQYASSSGSSFSTRVTFVSGDTIPAHGYFLAAGDSYTGPVEPDTDSRWSSGLAQTGGHVRLEVGGVELDRFGWGTAAAPEGAAFPASPDGIGSYERKARSTSDAGSMAGSDASAGNDHDTDNNAADFVRRATADPQGTASAPESP